MGRPRDRQQVQTRRAREELDKGIKRRDAGLAVESWLKLPPEERAPLLSRVGGLLREEIERLAKDRLGQQARLLALAALVAPEPALLGERRDLCWTLFVAALRARDLGRARRLYALIEAEVASRAPAMHAWLAAFLAGGGQIDPALVASLPPLPGPDPRLGYDAAPRPRVKLPTPRSAEEAELLVRTLFAIESRPASLRDTVLGWIQEAPSLGPVLARVAGPLSVREALLRARAGHGPGLMLVLLGELVRLARDELAADVFLGFRLASAAQHKSAGHLRDAEALRAFASLAAAVATYPEHRPAVVAQAIELEVPESWNAGSKVQLDLYGTLLQSPEPPDVRLWARALTLFVRARQAEQGEPGKEIPVFLSTALTRLLGDREGAPLWEWIAQESEPRVLMPVIMGIGEHLPMDLGERVLEKGFAYKDKASDDERVAPAMTRLLLLLVKRQDVVSLSVDEATSAKGATWGDLRRLVIQMESMGFPLPDDLFETVEEMDPATKLPREMSAFYVMLQRTWKGGSPMMDRQRALLRRYQDQAAPHSYEVFTLAAAEVDKSHELLHLAERYLSGTPAIEARINVMQILFEREFMPAYKQIKDRMLAEFSCNAPALASALHLVLMSDGPMPLRRELAGALLAADQAYKGERDERYQQMVRFASLYAPRARAKTPKKTPKAKAPAKTPRAKAPAKTPRAKAPAKTPRAKAPAKAPAKSPADRDPNQMELPEVRK